MGRASGWRHSGARWGRLAGTRGYREQRNPSLPGRSFMVPGQMVEPVAEKRRNRAFGSQEEFLGGQAELKARDWASRLG